MKFNMNGSRYYVFTLGIFILFGISVFFSYNPVFAQVETLDSPIDLDAEVISSTQIDLSWSKYDDNDISITGYKIETRINTDSEYSVVVEDTGSTDTEYSHTDLIPDTIYAYRVSAVNLDGTSEPSSSTTVKTSRNNSTDSNESIEDSDVPTNVTIKAISSTSVELSWDAPTQTFGQTIQNYMIKQELTSGVYENVGNTSGSDTKHTISNLSADKMHVFVVTANYALGSSADSDEVKITLNSSSVTDDDDDKKVDDVPDRPTDLEADAVSSTKIDLSWDAPDENKSDNNDAVTGYKIEAKKLTESRYDIIVEDTKSTSTKYSHTGLDEDTDYVYRVSAINSEGESDESSEARTKTLSSDDDDDKKVDDVPDRPTDLEADAVSSTKIDLSWDAPDENKSDNNDAVTGYKIEAKKLTESRYDIIVEDTKSTSTKYSHTGLDEDTDYVYRVSAINSEGESDESSEARTKTLSSDDDDDKKVDDVPDRPTDLEADAVSSTKIDLSWDAPDENKSDNNDAVTGYKIEAKKLTESRYDIIVEDTKSTSTKYSHTGLDEDTDYVYRVSAINSEGESDESSEARTKTLSSDDDDDKKVDDVPDRPTDLEADAVSSTKIDLSWDAPDENKSDNNDAVTGYKIEAKKLTESRYDIIVEDTKSTSTKYSHTGLDEDTDYVYRVSAINSEGESDESSEARTKTLSSDDDDDDDDDNTSQQNSSTSGNTSQQNSSTSGNTSQQNSSTSGNTSQQNSSTSGNTSQQNSSTSGNTSQQNSSTSGNTSQQNSSTSGNTSQQNSSTSGNTSQQNSSTSGNTSQQNSSTSGNTSQQNSSTSGNDVSINDVKNTSIKSFSNIIDPEKDPQYYVDRYNNESAYKDWFDRNFPEITIHEALGVEEFDTEPTTAEPTTAEPTTAEPTTAEPTTAEPTTAEPTTAEPTTAEPTTAEPTTAEPTTAEPTHELALFVDPEQDPQYYVDRYNNESGYKDWFDKNYPEYSSIYQAVGLTDPANFTDQNEVDSMKCGPGTEQVGDICVVLQIPEKPWWQFW